ncbi:hypothetical protein M8C21_008819 [Ambrosia artemisiifolia]|uniref:Uncharacterized protein n=1 Tax=Ambrosia artemisiifolia TaxID=4212 RepID=A0AAD5GJ11_AMBAR|nr:hypothetical protein M8C21_008819 [Ambrosia artemisiifolia]
MEKDPEYMGQQRLPQNPFRINWILEEDEQSKKKNQGELNDRTSRCFVHDFIPWPLSPVL